MSTPSPPSQDIHFRQVSKSFGDIHAVKNISLRIPHGQLYGFLGPNGAGKTTCLRMLLSIILPDSGEITLFGGATAWDLRDEIGYLPEERGLYKRMKVLEHLKFLAELKGKTAKEAEPRIMKWLETLDLADRCQDKGMDLSKGNQQKIQFIGALAHDPKLLVLDEVFSGLDPINAQQIRALLMQLKEEGKTIIFSTHIMEHAEQICDGICLVHKGQCVLEGPLDDLKRHHGNNRIRIEHIGDIAFLKEKPYTASLRSRGNESELRIHDGHEPEEVIKDLLEANIKLRTFQLANPSLNELFMEMVEHPSEASMQEVTNA